MKIPKKISPDSIKDALVEIRYVSPYPFEVLIGMFFQHLDETYTYTNRPLGKPSIPLKGLPEEINISIQAPSLFYNDRIKIQLLPNSIVFNILNEYISWDNYRPQIEKALIQMSKSNAIEKFTRIGIRYITHYPNHDLHSCVKFEFTFGLPTIKSEKYSFQSEFEWENLRVILNLKHKLPVARQKDSASNLSAVSIIDIDTIADNLDLTELGSLMHRIDEVRLKEKKIFFNLLREDFLKSLKPEY